MLSLCYEKKDSSDEPIMINPSIDRRTGLGCEIDVAILLRLSLLSLSSGRRSGLDTSSIPGNEGSVIIHRYQQRTSGSFRSEERRTGRKEQRKEEKRAGPREKERKGRESEKERDSGGFSLQSFLYGNHRMPVPGPEPRVWHNNLRFKSNLGYISNLSTRRPRRPPTSSGRSVLSLLFFLLLLLILPLLPFSVSRAPRLKCGRRGREQRSPLEVVPRCLIDFRAFVRDTKSERRFAAARIETRKPREIC